MYLGKSTIGNCYHHLVQNSSIYNWERYSHWTRGHNVFNSALPRGAINWPLHQFILEGKKRQLIS